jgi:hypothetical protein
MRYSQAYHPGRKTDNRGRENGEEEGKEGSKRGRAEDEGCRRGGGRGWYEGGVVMENGRTPPVSSNTPSLILLEISLKLIHPAKCCLMD